MMDSMCKTAEEFYQELGIPYRIVNIVSGMHFIISNLEKDNTPPFLDVSITHGPRGGGGYSYIFLFGSVPLNRVSFL